ncbi:MAG: ATP-dependent Clp protease proteolytic subunit [Phycisphaeraceae bacterium]|nr:ATP-dependent Clp protease proteolytic subunit [Phycisphaeraceae bacterium]
MTPSQTRLARLFPAAALIAALGLPLTACAQDQVVETVEAPTVQQAEQTQQTPVADTAEAEKPAEDEKTPEEIAKEEAKKELEKLQREAQLRSARLSAELAPLKEEKQRIEAELALLNTKQQDAHAKAKLEKQQADFLASLRLAEMNREMQVMQQQMQAMQTKLQIEQLKKQAEAAELAAANARLAAQTSALQAELALVQTKRSAAAIDKDEMQYPAQPLNNGVLTISDRRIPLNNAIGNGTADFVTERLHYFNNLNDEAPIFIVIDKCPGGSVMEGYAIVTAMQNSKAPVHVVVKQYAASMAAVITTLADHSYTYPNAVILHHQMSSGMRGNLTQQKESLEEGFEWAKRLANPVAKKMGVTYDEFTELMYKNNSDGDWAEFGDKAKELKWVNHVVEDIRETALVTAPKSQVMPMFFFEADTAEQAKALAATMPRPLTQEELFRTPSIEKAVTDGNGNTYIELPPLSPYDYYFLHNPNDRYRLAK